MDYANIQSAMDRAIRETEQFHALANALSLRDRNRVLKRLRATDQDPLYAPWGGLFPHPRVKKEGW
jgi:hypothetical protein